MTDRPIVICYDRSPSARHAFEVASRFISESTVVLLHVWHPPGHVAADSFGIEERATGPSDERLRQLAEQGAAAVLADGEALAAEFGVAVTTRSAVAPEETWQTIIDLADELDACLIVVGTRGSTPAQPGLLGSVSSSLLHHSERPVLVVPDGDGTRVAAGHGEAEYEARHG